MRGAGGAAGRSGGGKQTEGSGGERRDPAPGAVSGAGPPSPDPARAAAAGPRGAAAKMTVPVSADRRGPRAPRCRPGPPGVAGGSSRVVCGGGNRMGAPPPRRLLRPCSSSLLQDSRGEPGPVLAPPGAPRDGWVGERVCVGLFRAPGAGGAGGGPRSSPTSYQSGQVDRGEGSVTPWKPVSRSAGPAEGSEGLCCSLANSLGELPYCAPGSPPGWPGVGRGLCCPRDTLTPEWLAWLVNRKTIPPPASALCTHLVGSFVEQLIEPQGLSTSASFL